MKTKNILIITAALNLLPWQCPAQEQSVVVVNPSPGVGVGVGVGAGVGLAGNIQVERIPGNVVQGRRVFAAKFVCGANSASSWVPKASGGPPGPDMSITSVCETSQSFSSTSLGTVVSILNPNTNAVTLTRRAVLAGGPIVTNISETLPAGQALRLDSGDIGWMLGNPPGFPGAMSTGFVVIESRSALEVVALYTYSSSESTIETKTEIHEECHCSQYPHTCGLPANAPLNSQ